MCGLAGFMAMGGGRGLDEAALEKMSLALKHRGPDGGGKYIAGSVSMVHTRLAIVDVAGGAQPFQTEAGVGLVANGEIYNDLELRAGLNAQLGAVAFTSHSDCETPLHLYCEKGAAYVEDLRGMYAIAIHDRASDQLFLSRDPFGIKPLYYTQTPRGFAFASQPQAFFAAGLKERKLEAARRDELLQLQFVPGSNTIFSGINRVLPGETLSVIQGRISQRSHHCALPQGGPVEMDEETALERLDGVLEESVDLHQRSDVPYGMFLSGGIDSSALLVMMARLNQTPVRTFTAGFSGTRVSDERAQGREVARRLKADHEEVDVTRKDFFSLLPQVAGALDDPVADYAVLPTWKLAQRASQDVKVILSGEGGDEMFAGYGRYRAACRSRLLGGREMRTKGTFDGLDVLRSPPLRWRDQIATAQMTAARGERTRLQSAQALDCATWLPDDLLIKLDRCLMAHGVEGRTPFIDVELADFAFCLPDHLKVRQRNGKWLLRKWLDRQLPAMGAFDRKKGFTVPVGEWIRQEGPRLGSLVAATPAIAEIAGRDAVCSLFISSHKRAGFAAWTLLFYALWHRAHIEGQACDGDIFEVLNQKS